MYKQKLTKPEITNNDNDKMLAQDSNNNENSMNNVIENDVKQSNNENINIEGKNLGE